jgi:hypothetical protein
MNDTLWSGVNLLTLLRGGIEGAAAPQSLGQPAEASSPVAPPDIRSPS